MRRKVARNTCMTPTFWSIASEIEVEHDVVLYPKHDKWVDTKR